MTSVQRQIYSKILSNKLLTSIQTVSQQNTIGIAEKYNLIQFENKFDLLVTMN